MATYPTAPGLPVGDSNTPVNPANWNALVSNINAIGADLVDARSDSQIWNGTPHTAGQSTDINDMLCAIRNMIADITGEVNWYNEVDTSIAALYANQGGLAHTQFLRSDTDDQFTVGSITFNAGTILSVQGTLTVGSGDLTLNEDFTIGDGHPGTLTFNASGKTLTVAGDSVIDQDLSSSALVEFGGILLPASSYISFGATYGTTGYGIRDNVGTLEYKNQSGVWGSIGTGGAGDSITEGNSLAEVVDLGTGYFHVTIDAAEIIRVTPTGLGILETTPAWPLDLAGAALFQPIAQPGAPSEGVIYTDSTNHKLYFWDGSAWKDLTASASGTMDAVLSAQDAWATDVTYNVPTAVGKTGHIYTVYKTDNQPYKVIVDPDGTETISGASTHRLKRQYQQLSMISDGADWWKISDTQRKLDVTDFGMTGDGTTDCGPAFIKVMRAAYDRDTIYFPIGNYKFTKPVYITKRVNIVGDGYGTQIYQSADEDLFVIDAGGTFGSLDGSAKYYSGGNVLNGGTDDISVSIRMKWLTIPMTTGVEALIAKANSTTSQGYMLWIEGGYVYFMVSDGTDTFYVKGATKLNYNTEYHIAGVIDRDNAGNCKIYLDGANDTDTTNGTIVNVDSITNAVNFVIGAESDAGNKTAMYVWDVRIDMSVWSAANVLEQYHNRIDSSKGGTYDSYWYFDDSAGATSIDDKVGANNLSFVGGTTTNYGTHSRTQNTGGYQYVHIEDIYLHSAATTSPKSLLKLSRVHDATIRNLYIQGGYYGVYIYGSLRNRFYHLEADSSSGAFGACSTCNTNVYISPSSLAHSNANQFYGIALRKGTNGIYINEYSEGNIYVIGGVIEGLGGYGIKVSGCVQGFDISDLHIEGLGGNGITVNYASPGTIRNVYCTDLIEVISSANILVQNSYLNSIDVDETSYGFNISNCKHGSGAWSIRAGRKRIHSLIKADGTAEIGGELAYVPINLCAGDLEVWESGLPIGFTSRNATVAQETTIKRFGASSAHVTYNGGTPSGIEFAVSQARWQEIGFPDQVNLVSGAYGWTASGGGTNEYYLTLAGGGDPGVDEPLTVLQSVSSIMRPMAEGTLGALAASNWGYGDNDTLGFNTIYVRLADGSDPDAVGHASGYVSASYKTQTVSAAGWFYRPYTNPGVPVIGISYYSYGSEAGVSGYIYQPVTISNYETWTKGTVTFNIPAHVHRFNVLFGIYYAAANHNAYVDGCEVVIGDIVSNNFPSYSPSAYAITNRSNDRALDCNSTTTAELADVLGTLIYDLQLRGLIG